MTGQIVVPGLGEAAIASFEEMCLALPHRVVILSGHLGVLVGWWKS